jgi:hypothetical protein
MDAVNSMRVEDDFQVASGTGVKENAPSNGEVGVVEQVSGCGRGGKGIPETTLWRAAANAWAAPVL